MKLERIAVACAVLMMSALLATGPAAAQTETIRLTMSSSHPTVVPWVGALKTHVIAQSNKELEAMGSKYRIQWNEAFGGVLYDFNNTLEAVEQGVTDMGWVGALWEPAKLPLQNIMFATPFVTSDEEIAVDVMNKMNDTIPAMKAEWQRYNLVFLGATVSDTYHLFTKFPIKSLDDLNGKKIVAATSHAPWIKAAGATPVSAGLPAFYQMLQTGVADGTLIISTGAFSFKLYEVAPYITIVDLGVTTIGGFAVNGNTWQKLPPDVKKVLAKLGREYSTVHAKEVKARVQSSLDKMVAAGSKMSTLSEADRKRWIAAMPNIAKEFVETNSAKGVPAADIMKTYMNEMRAHGAKPLRNWDEGL
ncbi:MAG: C4-dicarboxylate TRAP transporter substrate-binding protein [Burkholderiales bacterium]